ncbi:hypothetical protein FB451DRAFT_1202374 [Mycena latifolia]|nr:hypothetical protein FB451DRAFT_1202374 [Mycena latifolia]
MFLLLRSASVNLPREVRLLALSATTGNSQRVYCESISETPIPNISLILRHRNTRCTLCLSSSRQFTLKLLKRHVTER